MATRPPNQWSWWDHSSLLQLPKKRCRLSHTIWKRTNPEARALWTHPHSHLTKLSLSSGGLHQDKFTGAPYSRPGNTSPLKKSYWSIRDTHCCISFRYTTWWVNNFIHYAMSTTSVPTIGHHTLGNGVEGEIKWAKGSRRYRLPAVEWVGREDGKHNIGNTVNDRVAMLYGIPLLAESCHWPAALVLLPLRTNCVAGSLSPFSTSSVYSVLRRSTAIGFNSESQEALMLTVIFLPRCRRPWYDMIW